MSEPSLNVLILAAGANSVDGPSTSHAYPACVAEIDGTPLIERIVSGLSSVPPANFCYCFRANDVRRFHLDNLVQVLTPGARIVNVLKGTKGSAAAALMAMASMDADAELLIISADEWVNIDLMSIVRELRDRQLDAGTLTFHSVHPRYAYVRLGEDELVSEAAQRNPISAQATTGVFWFRNTAQIKAAIEAMIRKGGHVDGDFYLAPAINELLLRQARVGVLKIEANAYRPIRNEREPVRPDVLQADAASPWR